MAILDEVLRALCAKLEAALQAADPAPLPWVALSNLVGPDGLPEAGLDGKVVVSLIALQSVREASVPSMAQPGGGRPQPPAPLWLDANLVVLAKFSGTDYPSGLAMISRTIAFFHERPVLAATDMPELPAGVDRIAVELISLDLPTAAAILPEGLRTLPFALYRLRRLPLE